jgi:hypothetical protein
MEIAQNINAAWISAGFENKQRLQKLANRERMVYKKQDG